MITTVLQFSGGKDSLACLHLWKERGLLDETMVMWCNSGAPYQSTLDQMERVKDSVPHFMEVKGNQPAVVERYGYPSDVVPVLHSRQAQVLGGSKRPLIQSWMDCCGLALWEPMYRATKELGVRYVVRGQRNDETLTGPVRHGDTHEGITYLLPLQDWSAADVLAYLRSVGAELPEYYDSERTSRDCWSCTAFRFESKERTDNLTGEQREVVFARLEQIRSAIAEAGY